MLDIILLVVAVIPGIVLMALIYRHDRIEKEPIGLLVGLLIAGAFSAVPIIFVELFFDSVLSAVFYTGSVTYILLENFIGVALVEEAGKFLATRILTWKNKSFDYLFDGIIYAVFASLGFAILENILYVTGEASFFDALEVGAMRAVLSVPLHCFCGVFMGFFYGLARKAASEGNTAEKRQLLAKALVVPTLLHGYYDFCLSIDNELIELSFFVFVIVMYIFAFRRIKTSSKHDERIKQSNAVGYTPSEHQGNYTQNKYMPNTATTNRNTAVSAPASQPLRAPYMPHTPWRCYTCGSTNTGNFCTCCGSKRPVN